MMVIGFIAAIAMCYVGVWLLNSGFSTVLAFLDSSSLWSVTGKWGVASTAIPWASLFGFFFVVVIYTMIYLTLVEKSFSLIAVLPDKVLRWVGGQPESIGEQASQWTQDTKGKIDKAAGDVDRSMGAMQKGLAQEAMGGAKKIADKFKGKSSGGDISGGGSQS
jgi:defect-in-organelle-trafficking protein DotA